MAIAIYKPGQGYWVRVITATMLGIIVLATAGWLWSQMKVVSSKLPKTTWVVSLGESRGTPQPGQAVNLLQRLDPDPTPAVIGTAVVKSYAPTNKILHIHSVVMKSDSVTPSEASLIVAQSDAAAFTSPIVGRSTGQPIIEPVLLQGGVVAIVLLLGAVLVYWLTAVRAGSVDFLVNTDMEMKKVNWSSRKDIMASTGVVIGAAFLIASFLFLVDFAFQGFFRLVGVLET